jgi:hypothetical protein
MTLDPEAHGTGDDRGRNPSYKTTDWGVVLKGPPHKIKMEEVSSTCCLLISCHKQLSFKLHVEGESNGLVESTLL